MNRALLILLLAAQPLRAAQSAGPEIPQVLIQAKVFGMPRADLRRLYPDGPARPLPQEAAQGLENDPQARLIHRLELRTTPGMPIQLRIDTRLPDGQVEIGIGLEITPQVFPTREVVLATTSRVQIRKTGEAALSPLFEAQAAKQSPKLSEGQAVLIGGFLNTGEANRLPVIPLPQDNPILRYLYSTKLQPKDTGDEEYEIVALLTPRVIGTIQPEPLVVDARYTVQVGAFEKSANAERLVTELKKKKFEDVYMEKPAGSGLYRVRIGRLPDRSSAGQLRKILSAQGFDPFVASLD